MWTSWLLMAKFISAAKSELSSLAYAICIQLRLNVLVVDRKLLGYDLPFIINGIKDLGSNLIKQSYTVCFTKEVCVSVCMNIQISPNFDKGNIWLATWKWLYNREPEELKISVHKSLWPLVMVKERRICFKSLGFDLNVSWGWCWVVYHCKSMWRANSVYIYTIW